MGSWTFVRGMITVSPLGRTQAEKRYILETVLDHLPFVTGSERDMNVYIISKNGCSGFSSHTEFGEPGSTRRHGSLSTEIQNEYILVVDGSLRNREFNQTFKEFQKWICRLAKRVPIEEVLVEIEDWQKSVIIQNTNDVYYLMFEDPSWCNDTGEPTWCEYLMWQSMKRRDYPRILGYKYFYNEENDKKVEEWMGVEDE